MCSDCSDLIQIPNVRMYTEVQAEDVAISLFIKRLSDEDAGLYRCTAVYAGNMYLEASVSVSIFRELISLSLTVLTNHCGSGHHVARRAPGAVRQSEHRPQDQMQGSGQPRRQH